MAKKYLDPGVVKPADIIGFSGDSWLSAAINVATYGLPFWHISHVGIMAHAEGGRLLLFESTSLEVDEPCEITGRPIIGTQAHSLERILKLYGGAAWHYPHYRPLYPCEDHRLSKFLTDTIGTPYDKMGAMRAGGVGLSWVESLFRKQDLTSIFCSEWAAAAYAYVGLHPTDNVSRWSPNRLIRHLRNDGILGKPRRLQ
jgi:hypothetical protein